MRPTLSDTAAFLFPPPGRDVNWAFVQVIVVRWRVASRMPTVKVLLIWSSFKINIPSFGRCLQSFKPKTQKRPLNCLIFRMHCISRGAVRATDYEKNHSILGKRAIIFV